MQIIFDVGRNVIDHGVRKGPEPNRKDLLWHMSIKLDLAPGVRASGMHRGTLSDFTFVKNLKGYAIKEPVFSFDKRGRPLEMTLRFVDGPLI